MNSSLIQNFLQKLAAEDGLAKNTILSYQKDLELLQKFLVAKKISFTIATLENLKAYFYYLHDENLKTASIARKISCFKNFFKFLEDEKLVKSSIAANLETPKKDFKLPKALSEKEIFQLLDFANKSDSAAAIRMSCMLEILYAAGLRVSELVSLPLDAIQEEKNYLIVKGKGSKERIAPLGKAALRILKKFLELRNTQETHDSRWLFVGGKNTKKDSHLTRQQFHRLLKDLALQAGIDPDRVHPHAIRHSFATHLLNRGVDLRILQELLGHSDISTTQIYTHILDSKLKDLVFSKHPLNSSKKSAIFLKGS